MKVITKPKHGDAIDATQTMYPSRLRTIAEKSSEGSATSTLFGYVLRGRARFRVGGLDVSAEAGSYFSIPGSVDLEVEGLLVTIERFGFRGMMSVGSIETEGRLSYIDGCTDSILVMPPRLGDPVLNHLHFPAGIDQTQHRHPSVRLGVVARGAGIAHGPGWEQPLVEGCVFLLDAHETHSFRTPDRSMDVIAFHPDSDWGPTDAAHPMLNRTYLTRGGS